jgi:uncharacterized phiE125 gp8 family phage protein
MALVPRQRDSELMRFEVTEIVGDEQVSLAEAKDYCRVDDSVNIRDDAYITDLIRTARDIAEGITGRGIVEAKREIAVKVYSNLWVDLPRPPYRSIESVVIRDEDYANPRTLTATEYTADLSFQPPRLWLNTTYPNGSVTVNYTSGYRTELPPMLKTAMLEIIRYKYDNPTSTELPPMAKNILKQKRLTPV